MVGSVRKPVLIQDTEYMVEKTYHIAQYEGAFGAYLMYQWPIYDSKSFHIPKRLLEHGGQLTLSSIWSKSH